MASNIQPQLIDITYPIAGQDNDTQGFRNNYQGIQTNFITAATEITNLQSNVGILQTNQYGNTNVATYLQSYTGTIDAGNINVSGNIQVGSNIHFTSSTITLANAVPTTIYAFGAATSVYLGSFGSNVAIGGNIITNQLTLTSVIQFANLTTTQINAVSSPQRGMTAYNYSTGNIQVYNGTKWANITLS
jgi:hypothetical protein